MHIVFANESHIPGMIELLKQVGEVHHRIRPDLFRPGTQKYNEADLAALLKDPSKPIFVAEEEGRVLGYCFCQLREYKNGASFTDRKELYIDDLCVDEQCRGQHIGKRLYDHTCAWAKEIGCSYLTLNVWCGNDSAMAFYEKRGLKPRSITMETNLEDIVC